MNIRVLYLSECSDMGGAEHSLFRLMKSVKQEGITPILLCQKPGELTELCNEAGILVIFLEIKKIQTKNIFKIISRMSKFICKVREIVKEKDIDLIHANTSRTRFYLSVYTLFNIIPTVAHVRDIKSNKYENFMVERIDRTVAISEAVKTSICKKLKGDLIEKINVLYNGVEDLSQLNKCRENSRLKIGLIGRIESWKNQKLFIEAIEIINRDDIEFYIVGGSIKSEHDSYFEEVKKLILISKSNIVMTGHVNNPFDYMADFKILVCPSDNEPFGRVIIEAMSMKKLIVASRSGGIPEILDGGLSCQLFKNNCAKSLAKKIAEVLNLDNESYTELAERNYLGYKERFSLEANTKKTIALYTEVINAFK